MVTINGVFVGDGEVGDEGGGVDVAGGEAEDIAAGVGGCDFGAEVLVVSPSVAEATDDADAIDDVQLHGVGFVALDEDGQRARGGCFGGFECGVERVEGVVFGAVALLVFEVGDVIEACGAIDLVGDFGDVWEVAGDGVVFIA